MKNSDSVILSVVNFCLFGRMCLDVHFMKIILCTTSVA